MTAARRRAALFLLAPVLIAGAAYPWWGPALGRVVLGRGRVPADPLAAALENASAIPSARTSGCGRCHPGQFERWKGSQHAWANRRLDADLDGPAFAGQAVTEGARRTELRRRDGRLEIVTTGPDGQPAIHQPVAAIGIEPLRQYLVPFPGGRLHVLDAAFDPGRREWFGVFAGEHRRPGEWGFWTGRGFNWTAQCAGCHMTGFRKGYDIASDTYRPAWDEMGVACAQCHGAMPRHAAAGGNVPVEERITPARRTDTCAGCHARREELTDRFRPGEDFHDHFRLMLADAPGLYHPDGQVRDENFEYGSFLGSRMGHQGVSCLDCHDAHSGKLRLPAGDNSLCLACHAAPGQRGARVVDPVAHARHRPGSAGAACVECHMPVTVYMARDARRDHGFTSPDPALTQELGIPNACNRCHTDRLPAWAREWTDRWYGDRVRRPVRVRARAVARAQRGDAQVVPRLLELAAREENVAWRGALVALLAPWSAHPDVASALTAALGHPHAVVRAAATRALESNPAALSRILPLRDDPVRLVRLDAMLVGLGLGAPVTRGREDFDAYLAVGSDQPAGALRQTRVALAERRLDDAERWIRAGIGWDPASAALQHTLGRVLHARGRHAEAESAFGRAAALEPASADHPYALALLQAEGGRMAEAAAALERAVTLSPGLGRAWYNLGLAYARQARLRAALDALGRAEALMPASADPPHALASVHARLGDPRRAREAAERAARLREVRAPRRRRSARRRRRAR